MSSSNRIALVAALALAPALVTAQSAQRFSVQGSVLQVSPSGEAYEGLSSGIGFEVQGRYTPSALSIGLGYQTSSHDLEFDDGSTETVTLSGVFAEPRYVLAVGSEAFAPYLAGRIALLTQSIDIEGVTASASGTQFNVGGGLLFRLSPRINLDLGLTYGAIDFKDVEVEYLGETYIVEGSSGSGKNLVLRAGVTVGL